MCRPQCDVVLFDGQLSLNRQTEAAPIMGAEHDSWRWPVLMLSCLLMVGNYYCYDGPAALKSQLQQHFNQLSRDDFEWRFVSFLPDVASCSS